MHHSKFNYVKKVVYNDIAVLLEGPAGCGKSTLAREVASELKLDFYAMSLTKQSSVNSLLGFISINGSYIPTQFRKAFEYGGVFLLDELNAADPNVLLCLNTIENGYISFPDGIIQKHKDFRLIATSNPNDSVYTGRSKLDFATEDRFLKIVLEKDDKLEEYLTSAETKVMVDAARSLYTKNGISKVLSMRDTIRLHKLITLNLDEEPVRTVAFSTEETDLIYKEFKETYEKQAKANAEKARKANMTYADAKSLDELSELFKERNSI